MKNRIIFFAALILILFDINAFAQLNGNYKIGSGGNFSTISSAVSALHSQGISGPVTFNILDGTYDEPLTIDSINGSSPVNNITFQSLSGNYSDVTWSSTSASTIIILRGTDYISFKNISFNSQQTSFEILQGCKGINIQYCKLKAGFIGVPVLCNFTAEDLNITGNIINAGVNGGYAVWLENAINILVKDNQIQCNTALQINNQPSGLISIINNRTFCFGATGNFPTAVLLRNCFGSIDIQKNVFLALIEQVSPTYGIDIENCAFSSSIIANNFIESPTIISNSSNVNLYFNTFHYEWGFAESGIHIGLLSILSSSNCRILNNIISNAEGPSYANSFNSSIISDFNVFHTLNIEGGPVFGYYNDTGYTDINLFRAASNNDFRSIIKDPQFISDNDFHLTGSSLGDTSLIGMPLPAVPRDIDNNLRNPLYPYRGADEVVDFPLPVELESFTSLVSGNDVYLIWSTYSETNNARFEIERSNANAQEWTYTGSVNGNGSTNSLLEYEFTDKDLLPGNYNYRLKQIDYNGSFEYHNLLNEVVINSPQKYELLQNYPNPFNPKTVIEYNLSKPEFVSIKLFNSSGSEVAKLVNEKKSQGGHKIVFDGSGFSSGVYYYKIESGEFSYVRKMILLK